MGAVLELASEGASQLLDRWPAAQDELLWLLNPAAAVPGFVKKHGCEMFRS